jgi:hypothetical protein
MNSRYVHHSCKECFSVQFISSIYKRLQPWFFFCLIFHKLPFIVLIDILLLSNWVFALLWHVQKLNDNILDYSRKRLCTTNCCYSFDAINWWGSKQGTQWTYPISNLILEEQYKIIGLHGFKYKVDKSFAFIKFF